MDSVNNAQNDLHEKISNLKIHGFSNAFSAKEYPQRSTWLLVSLLAVGFTTYGIITSVLTFATFPVKIDITYRDEVLRELPAVTICNMNWRRKSQITPLFAFGKMAHGVQSRQFIVTSQDEVTRVGNQISDMLISCHYKMDTCSSNNFI